LFGCKLLHHHYEDGPLYGLPVDPVPGANDVGGYGPCVAVANGDLYVAFINSGLAIGEHPSPHGFGPTFG